MSKSLMTFPVSTFWQKSVGVGFCDRIFTSQPFMPPAGIVIEELGIYHTGHPNTVQLYTVHPSYRN